MRELRIIKAPCETCLHKNGVNCISALALMKTALSMEAELYNHGVQKLVTNFILPCGDYVNENEYMKRQLKKIV